MRCMVHAMIGSVAGITNHHIAYETTVLLRVVEEVGLVRDRLYIISDFLKSCNGKQSEEIEGRLSKINELVHDANNVVITCMNQRRVFWSRGRITVEIIDIRRKLEEICKLGLESAQSVIGEEESDAVVQFEQCLFSQRQTPWVSLEASLMGFDAEKIMIINQITRGDAELKTVGIWGNPGIGKTTLCQSVYNDLVVANHFDLRGWVCFSYVRTRREFLEAIMDLVDFNRRDMKVMTEEMLRLELYRYMKSTRYLVVLDDVCESKLCEDLSSFFPKNTFGSRIIITTRLEEVVLALNSSNHSYSYNLQLFNIEKSWNLLSNQVFRGGKCPSELMDLGIKIAHKCAGLPVAISVISGVLRIEKTVGSWSRVLSSLSAIIHDQTEFLELSYSYLPHHLRRCFLYLGHFPRDFEIPSRQLTLSWIAEGLIPKRNCMMLEEVAHLFLQELVYRNLVQPAQRKSDGSVKSLHIHDLVLDFCISKSKSKSNGANDLKYQPTASTLHYISSNHTAPHVRELLCFGIHGERVSSKQWKYLYTGCILLRVLDLWDVLVDDIPSDIDKLISLRYLRLKSDSAQTLPPSICNLCNLQTLDVTAPLIERPQINIWKMHRLRHFYFNGEAVLPKPPKEIVKDWQDDSLTDLQTISCMSPTSCIESVLSKMPNLIKLGIYGDLEEDLDFHNLSKLKILRKLKLRRGLRYKKLSELPHGVQFPPSLVKLTFSQTELSFDPMEQLGRLPNLQVLKLMDSAYSGSVLDCSHCEFHQLKVLKLINLGITNLIVSVRSMPRLQTLVINRCGGLEGLPSSLKQMSTLRELQLWWPNVSVAAFARDISTQNEQLKLMIYHAQEI